MKKFGATLEMVDETICHILDTRDIRVITEVAARQQLEEDLQRMQASQARLSAAVEALKLAQEDAETVRHRVLQADLRFHWDDILTRRRNAFKSTPLYKRALPVLANYYNTCRGAVFNPHADEFRGTQVEGYGWW
jgi:hypothetical protein